MKYHNHIITKVIDSDVDGGCYYSIYRLIPLINPIRIPDKPKDKIHYHFSKLNKVAMKLHITYARTLFNAKEFIDTFDGENYNYNVLC